MVILGDASHQLREWVVFKISDFIGEIQHDCSMNKAISTKVYAATSNTSPLAPYTFERRSPNPSDVLIQIDYCVIFGRKKLAGSLIGGIRETQEMLDFCAKKKVFADIELINAAQINEAYERTIQGKVKYRFVIDAKSF